MQSIKQLESRRWLIWAIIDIAVGLIGLATYIYYASEIDSANAAGMFNRNTNGSAVSAQAAPCVLDSKGLSPDPGEAGKKTLAGIDCDHNGLRDDVQRWIYIMHSGSMKVELGLEQEARAAQ